MRCLSIHLTDLCNSKCSFCVVGSPLYKADSVEYGQVEAFLRDNVGGGFDAVNLHGGEATTHPMFIDTLRLIRGLGYGEVHLQTNAIKLADSQFAVDCADLGVSLFIVSLHGGDSATHDSQTGTPGGFKKTIKGISNVKTLGCRVRTNTVVTMQNLHALGEIVATACALGVDHINISNLHPVGSAHFSRERVMPALEQVVPPLESAVAAAVARKARVTLEGFPYCAVGRLRDYQLNNEYRDIKMLIRGIVLDNYDAFMSGECRAYGPPCDGCAVRDRCGGVYPEYTQFFGWSEFRPLAAETSGVA